MPAEIFTKKKIADVKKEEDNIDYEYMRRIERLQKGKVSDLKQLLMDYEEFLPEGLQKFRHAGRKEFKQLLRQIHGFFSARARGLPNPTEPTEFLMLLQPPMIVMPRMWAIQRSREEGRRMTWGEAFLELSLSGAITKILQTQDRMYRHIIHVANETELEFATDGSRDDEIAEIMRSKK